MRAFPIVGTVVEGGCVRPRVHPVMRQQRNILLKKVEALPCFEEVRSRLLKGEPCTYVAKDLHARGLWTDITCDQARKRLAIYKRCRLDNAAIIQLYAPRTVREKAKALEMVIDELGEYEKLYTIQKRRIDDFVQKEAQMPIPFKQIDECIAVAIQIVKAHADLRLEIGGLERVPQELNVNVDARAMTLVEGRYGKESLQRVLADPKKRAKVSGIVEKILMNSRLQEGVLNVLNAEKPNIESIVAELDDEQPSTIDAPVVEAVIERDPFTR